MDPIIEFNFVQCQRTKQTRAKLLFFIGNQRVHSVVGLPVDVCLDVGLLFVVLCQVTYPQEGSQHQ